MPMQTIDTLCEGLAPRLIKIDIEGAELLALHGAAKTLGREDPILVVAIHPDAMRALGSSPSELSSFLAEFGYAGQHLDGSPAGELGFEEIIFNRTQ
jgi:hypothetical protein